MYMVIKVLVIGVREDHNEAIYYSNVFKRVL
jgi:hypothetical protein